MQLADQLRVLLRSVSGSGPEVFLFFAVAVVVVADLVGMRRAPARHRRWLLGLSVVAVIAAGGLVAAQAGRDERFLFGSLLFLDGQAVLFKAVVTLAALVALLHTGVLEAGLFGPPPEAGTGANAPRPAPLPPDWLPLLLALLLGLYLMTMAVNLLVIYLSIELVSICSYLLTALAGNRKAAEGGIKYLLFGAVSSAIMLYGMSLLYGLTGTLDLTSPLMAVELVKAHPYVVFVAGLLTLTGILFKLSLVPFHVWTPDAYDAAPVPVASFFSVGPKAAALLVLMRVLTALPLDFQTPLAVIALASITLGNLSALGQTDAKRMLAYSTIAHAGFLLVGVAAFSEAGFEAATFYMATYLFINMGAFLLVDLLARQHGGSLLMRDFQGLGTRQPLLSLALTVVMLALTGLPPTVGFTAKLLAFSALWEAARQTGNPWLLALFGIGLFNVVISLFYYLRIPFFLYFRSASGLAESGTDAVVNPETRFGTVLALLLTLPVLLLFFRPNWLLDWIAGL